MQFLACGIEWYLLYESVVAWTLEVCDVRTLLAELIEFLGCQSFIFTHHIRSNNLSANLVSNL